jgi:hypothetical protein
VLLRHNRKFLVSGFISLFQIFFGLSSTFMKILGLLQNQLGGKSKSPDGAASYKSGPIWKLVGWLKSFFHTNHLVRRAKSVGGCVNWLLLGDFPIPTIL